MGTVNRPMCIPICRVSSKKTMRLILAPMEGLADQSLHRSP